MSSLPHCESFGVVFHPGFSAQELSTSELHSLNVWLLLSQHKFVFEFPSFHLTRVFGTLAGGLGSFPFDCQLVSCESDSRSSSWHSGLIFFEVTLTPPRNSVLYLHKTKSRLALKLFRRPSYLRVRLEFLLYHHLPLPFSTDVASVLHCLLRQLQPGHG